MWRSCAPGGGSLSAYEWRTSAWASPAAAADLITAAEDLCLDQIHVDVTGLAVEAHRGDVEAALRVLLDLAAESRVEIGALAGDPWWASSEGLVDASEVLDGIAEVNAGRDERIESVHFDVEPWGLDEWSEQKATLVEDYLAFVGDLVVVRDEFDGPAMHLSFLVPYWFDGSNGEAPLVEWNTIDAYPFQHLEAAGFDDVSWIVMAYRDRAVGEGGVIDLLNEEVSLSDVVGLALETAPVDPMTIMFADEQLDDLDRELTTVRSAAPGFDEVVINDFEHLRVLADRQAVRDVRSG